MQISSEQGVTYFKNSSYGWSSYGVVSLIFGNIRLTLGLFKKIDVLLQNQDWLYC